MVKLGAYVTSFCSLPPVTPKPTGPDPSASQSTLCFFAALPRDWLTYRLRWSRPMSTHPLSEMSTSLAACSFPAPPFNVKGGYPDRHRVVCNGWTVYSLPSDRYLDACLEGLSGLPKATEVTTLLHKPLCMHRAFGHQPASSGSCDSQLIAPICTVRP